MSSSYLKYLRIPYICSDQISIENNFLISAKIFLMTEHLMKTSSLKQLIMYLIIFCLKFGTYSKKISEHFKFEAIDNELNLELIVIKCRI